MILDLSIVTRYDILAVLPLISLSYLDEISVPKDTLMKWQQEL